MTAKWRWLLILLLSGGLLTAALPASVGQAKEEKKADKKALVKDETASDEVISDAVTAARLADYGRKHKSPESLLAAASILHSMKTAKLTPLDEKPTDENGKALDVKPLKNENFDDQANELFDEAALTANEIKLPGIDALIKEITARQTRDVVGGPQAIRESIAAHQTQVMRVAIVAGRPFTIGFCASFPMRFQAVHDATGGIAVDAITAGTSHSDIPAGAPGSPTIFTFRVQNLGNVSGTYQLLLK